MKEITLRGVKYGKSIGLSLLDYITRMRHVKRDLEIVLSTPVLPVSIDKSNLRS